MMRHTYGKQGSMCYHTFLVAIKKDEINFSAKEALLINEIARA